MVLKRDIKTFDSSRERRVLEGEGESDVFCRIVVSSSASSTVRRVTEGLMLWSLMMTQAA